MFNREIKMSIISLSVTSSCVENYTAKVISGAKIILNGEELIKGTDSGFKLEISLESKFQNEQGETILLGYVITPKVDYQVSMKEDLLIFQVKKTLKQEINSEAELVKFLQTNYPNVLKGKTWDKPPAIKTTTKNAIVPETAVLSKAAVSKEKCLGNVLVKELTKNNPMIMSAMHAILGQINYMLVRYKTKGLNDINCKFEKDGCMKLFCHWIHVDQDNADEVVKSAIDFKKYPTFGNLVKVMLSLNRGGRLNFGMYQKELVEKRQELDAFLLENVPSEKKEFDECCERVTNYLLKMLVVGCMETELAYPRLIPMCSVVNCRKKDCPIDLHWIDEADEDEAYDVFNDIWSYEKELTLLFNRGDLEAYCKLRPFLL